MSRDVLFYCARADYGLSRLLTVALGTREVSARVHAIDGSDRSAHALDGLLGDARVLVVLLSTAWHAEDVRHLVHLTSRPRQQVVVLRLGESAPSFDLEPQVGVVLRLALDERRVASQLEVVSDLIARLCTTFLTAAELLATQSAARVAVESPAADDYLGHLGSVDAG